MRLALALMLLAAPALAQTDIQLGGLDADPRAPVEVAADSLTVDQAAGTATYIGNVVIGQGDLRIAAQRASVVFDADGARITRFLLEGQVTFVTASEAAEAAAADYDLASGLLTLTGDVLLTQGASAISADRMVIDLNAGSARMEGRVRTVFQQAGE